MTTQVEPKNDAKVGELEQTFVGEFEHSVDEKGRLTIPQAFRELLAGRLFITRGLDGCLFILRPREFAALRPGDAGRRLAAHLPRGGRAGQAARAGLPAAGAGADRPGAGDVRGDP